MADVKISGLPASTLPLGGTEVLPLVQSGVTKKVASDDLTVKNVRSNATTGILQIAGPGVGTTRVMTTPDANFTVARTDAAQTFTGEQTFSGNLQTLLNDTVSTAKIGRTDRAYIELDRNDFDGNVFVYTTTSGSGGIGKRLEIAHTGNVTVSTGNLVIGTSGKGIDFSATPGTGTSELLADYEEGTWTPTGSGITFVSSSGKYTKVGNLVTCTFLATFPTTADTSIAYITGLPFVAGVYGGVAMSQYAVDVTYTASPGNTFLLPKNSAAAAFKTNANFSAKDIGGSISYQV